jgi:stage V sporulation protein G
MELTEVRIFLVNEEKLKAFANITINDCFVIRDLKVIQGTQGLFVAMPSKKKKDGTYRDTAHPLNNETRQMIEKKVLSEYETHVSQQETPEAMVSEMSQG